MHSAVLCLVAFAAELVDGSLGGGFGTFLAPLLILSGEKPGAVVSAILLAQAVPGLLGGWVHRRLGNTNGKVVLWTLAGNLIGVVVAAVLIGKILSPASAKAWIAAMAVMMGLVVTCRAWSGFREHDFARHNDRWAALIGLLAGFNKGGTGGGYGPLSVAGYLVMGLPTAVAIGSTTLAEGFACALGVAVHAYTGAFEWRLAIPLLAGSILAGPAGACLNHLIKIKSTAAWHRRLAGTVMVLLGAWTLLRVL